MKQKKEVGSGMDKACVGPSTKGSTVWGVSIEQYRSRIGSHGNFVKTKDILSRFKDHFWSVMLMIFH